MASDTTAPPLLAHAGAIDLQGLLRRLTVAGEAHEHVAVGDLARVIGRRSFAPVLLTASILGFTPLGAVPGGPTMLALIVILVASQIALGFRSL